MKLAGVSGDEWDRAWGTAALGGFLLGTSVVMWRTIDDREPTPVIMLVVAAVGIALGGLLLARGLLFVTRVQGAGLVPLLQRPTSRAPCPRCLSYERGATGWCDGCWGALQGGWLPAYHPVVRFNEALREHDAQAALACLDDCHVDHGWCRDQPRVGLRGHATFLRRTFSLFPDYEASVEIAAPDPMLPGVVWVRSVGTGRLRGVGRPQFARQVFRCHVEGDHIVETRAFQPLG